MGDGSIIAAVVTGAVGVVGAVFAWRTASATARVQADAQVRVEKLRADTALALEHAKLSGQRDSTLLELAAKDTAEIADALTECWSALQGVKNWAQAVAAGPEDRDLRIPTPQIASDIRTVSDLYRKAGAKLSEGTRDLWHDANGSAAIAENAVRGLRHPGLSNQDRSALIEVLRQAVTELQQAQDALAYERSRVLGRSLERA